MKTIVKLQAKETTRRAGALLAVFAVCLTPLFAIAETNPNTNEMFGSSSQRLLDSPLSVLPRHNEQLPAGLAFDLGGSDTRKLAFNLSRPLTLNINNSLQKSSSGVGSVFLDSSLSLHLNDNIDITTSLGAGKSAASFQPLGSVHCQNGVLDQGSYRASDCHFINQANVLKQDQIALGLRYGKGNFNTAVNMFRHQSSSGQLGVNRPSANRVSGTGMLSPEQRNPLLPGLGNQQSLDYLGGETSGLNLEFQLGLTTDSAGDIRLGLQLTRILDATYETSYTFAPGLQNWTIANPFDSAKVNLDWSKGNFSGGIQGFYREQMRFLDRENSESSTTFDVEFTWRAPWNANLSVGTSNVLNTGNEDNGKTDGGLQDPFEAIYGRIPYVRYQQDL